MYICGQDHKYMWINQNSIIVNEAPGKLKSQSLIHVLTTGVATLSIQPKNTVTRVTSSSAPSQLTPVTVKEQEITCQFVEVVNTQVSSLLFGLNIIWLSSSLDI